MLIIFAHPHGVWLCRPHDLNIKISFIPSTQGLATMLFTKLSAKTPSGPKTMISSREYLSRIRASYLFLFPLVSYILVLCGNYISTLLLIWLVNVKSVKIIFPSIYPQRLLTLLSAEI